ncbi:MAG: cytochrome c [Dehalococcoidia bacterium]|nr:cytochrome c [Dehalococcoidia bacterium]
MFNENCSRCHGEKGFGGIGPSLRKNTFFYEFSDRKIAEQIRGGKEIMPAFNESQISDQQVADLINLIRNWY